MKYHIITYGCQMNINDSERIASFFDENNLQQSSEKEAQIIIVNSCSIRQSAIDRLEAKIKKIKKESNQKIVILTGCVLEKDKLRISKICDYFLESKKISSWSLPFLIKKNTPFFEIKPKRSGLIAYISIMTGCNNFCSYCVVPYTKGRESSRPLQQIIQEVKDAVSSGHKEIWLLGQNVNSYAGEIPFAKLLEEINSIEGDFWIRFASSHPKDLSNDIINSIKKCEKVTNYIHLPLQSGSSKILKAMNRPYTKKDYQNIIKKIQKEIPNISISTDIIVGFPGETEKDFLETLDFFKKPIFSMAYVARYSKRPQTAAYLLRDNISNQEKRKREKLIEKCLEGISKEENKKMIGQEIAVMAFRKNKEGYLVGKTEGYLNIIFKGERDLIGKFSKVKITGSSSWGLKAKILKK